ncbi:helix-turn-helix domain-containing protein [Halobaculum gomorrense]|uniref:Predicted transcriptional regulator n=1 Tax=Halobaculum gomorrense TaxID=43928 RepID=A0A1M5TFR7_9EURY|nr:helix-turn-helix domain-containing protein [Halobaculum gomorrense]SHH49528.1 Predicted transcriptional regulator [Halobaculum gomorrense]
MSGNTAESPAGGFPSREERTVVSVSPEVDDVLSVAFDLGTHDLRVYHALIDRPSATTHELAEVVGIDRSNVNRSLGRLRERDLVRRRQRLLQEGGHCYVYTATEIEEARELLRDGLDAWTERARDELRGVLVPEP